MCLISSSTNKNRNNYGSVKEKNSHPRFYGAGNHIYEDELGWRLSMKKEVGSVVSKEIFRDQVIDVGLNLDFYYIDDDTYPSRRHERFHMNRYDRIKC